MKRGDLHLMRQLGICFTVVLLTFLISACRDMGTNPFAVQQAPPPPPQVDTVSFSRDILPVLENYGCTSCHGGTAGLTVGTVAGLLAGGLHGPAIVPGDAASSNIVKKISPNAPFGDRMPQGGPYLDAATIRLFVNWINQGAKNN